MGSDTLPARANGQTIDQTWFNILQSILTADNYPRNTSGIVTNEAGSLGSKTYQWLKAYIKSGHFACGDIKWMHTFGGAVTVPQGWFICDGTVINETNYDAQLDKAAGDWDTYVVTSPLNGLYSPNLIDKYPVGIADTTQDGSVAITGVGNAGHEIDIAHTHSHNHKWYNNQSAVTDDETFASNGASTVLPAGTDGTKKQIAVRDGEAPSGYYTLGDSWTDNDATSAGSATQSIQPESIAFIPLIRIVE